MSAHDQMRAMLDQLMGTARNGEKTTFDEKKSQSSMKKKIVCCLQANQRMPSSLVIWKSVRASWSAVVHMIFSQQRWVLMKWTFRDTYFVLFYSNKKKISKIFSSDGLGLDLKDEKIYFIYIIFRAFLHNL